MTYGIFRKRPVEVEAFLVDFENDDPLQPRWFTEAIQNGDIYYQGGEHPYYTVATKEGNMQANHGDWIIRGTHGEFYPIKQEIMNVTYAPVLLHHDDLAETQLSFEDIPQ